MRRATLFLAGLLAALLIAAPTAQAEFGLDEFDLAFENQDHSGTSQAGSHPFAVTARASFDQAPGEPNVLEGELKDIFTNQPIGLAGSPDAVPTCSTRNFLERPAGAGDGVIESNCPDATAIGTVAIPVISYDNYYGGALYNLEAPPGVAAKFGFVVATIPITLEAVLSDKAPYRIVVRAPNSPQIEPVFGAILSFWGVPGDPAHDPIRGKCASIKVNEGQIPLSRFGGCPVGAKQVPFLTLPRSCEGPVKSTYVADSWEEPGSFLASGEPDLSDPNWKSGFSESHDDSIPPNPLGMTGCGKLPFSPSITAQPTSKAASSPTGLDFNLDFQNEGIASSKEGAISSADLRKAVVTLPEGFSINPSIAEGLAVCSEAQLARETALSGGGDGCPGASKIGTVEAESPVISEALKGSIYQATPYENPFGSLVALYMVLKNPTLGVNIVQPLSVETDPSTGRITTIAEDLPQQPVSHFRLHFREGTRSPLATPSACGTYQVSALLYPSSGQAPVPSTSSFQIISGPNAGPCPKGGLPPFHPELEAGTLNNAAASFSPFNVKITRSDSEQEITHFSIKLPTGVAGKLAGIPFCSDAQIARAASRTGPHGGAEELTNPSCPAASQVGRTLAGAGVGSSLAYAPGKIYLAGPYHGAPISFVSITSGVVGPFDIGTVVVRLAIKVNPETGEVFLDSTGSDPIPHIIHGIPIHLRDIRAYTDRPEFTFNPTSCERKSTAATVLGSGLDFVSEADDNPFVSTSPFQAADCAALPFKPKLSLRLIGGTQRGDFPKLKAFLRMNGFGEAGVARAQVTLPRSEFIANAHFNTICTRVQFKLQGGNGEACPAGSIYGWARAKSPILSDPLEGPIFLRSSEHELPDVVASLRGQEINVHLVGHVDSVKGQLRNTFETVPDAPVEWASFSFQGQKKGLFENSTNLCAAKHHAIVKLSGQNGKTDNYNPVVQVKCKAKAKKGKAKHHKRAAR
jgi:hypothetical protein